MRLRLLEEERDGVPTDSDRLLTAKDVAVILRMPTKKVYALAIPRVSVTTRRIRYLESDVRAYIRRRRTAA